MLVASIFCRFILYDIPHFVLIFHLYSYSVDRNASRCWLQSICWNHSIFRTRECLFFVVHHLSDNWLGIWKDHLLIQFVWYVLRLILWLLLVSSDCIMSYFWHVKQIYIGFLLFKISLRNIEVLEHFVFWTLIRMLSSLLFVCFHIFPKDGIREFWKLVCLSSL